MMPSFQLFGTDGKMLTNPTTGKAQSSDGSSVCVICNCSSPTFWQMVPTSLGITVEANWPAIAPFNTATFTPTHYPGLAAQNTSAGVPWTLNYSSASPMTFADVCRNIVITHNGICVSTQNSTSEPNDAKIFTFVQTETYTGQWVCTSNSDSFLSRTDGSGNVYRGLVLDFQFVVWRYSSTLSRSDGYAIDDSLVLIPIPPTTAMVDYTHVTTGQRTDGYNADTFYLYNDVPEDYITGVGPLNSTNNVLVTFGQIYPNTLSLASPFGGALSTYATVHVADLTSPATFTFAKPATPSPLPPVPNVWAWVGGDATVTPLCTDPDPAPVADCNGITPPRPCGLYSLELAGQDSLSVSNGSSSALVQFNSYTVAVNNGSGGSLVSDSFHAVLTSGGVATAVNATALFTFDGASWQMQIQFTVAGATWTSDPGDENGDTSPLGDYDDGSILSTC
jgi:hypothetical protein